jgi:hypothetical protein
VKKQLTSYIGTKMDQGLDIFLCLNPDDLIWMIDVKTFGFGQQPMKPDDLYSVRLCRLSYLSSPLGRKTQYRLSQGIRSDLNPVVTQLGNISEDPINRPSLEKFVADSDLHLTGTCPASPTLWGEVPAYRQAGRGTLSKKVPFREAPFRAGASFQNYPKTKIFLSYMTKELSSKFLAAE